MTSFKDVSVEATFGNYPQALRETLLSLRKLIFDVAKTTEGVGHLSETLKWGQPSYLTDETGSGSTVRIDRFDRNKVAIYFHCQTTLVETFREMFPDLKYSKNRAIIIDPQEDIPERELRDCLEIALTYKLRKKKKLIRNPGRKGKDLV